MSLEFPQYFTDSHVDSIDDAFALANEWGKSGECDWFRGQAKPWALISSMSRLDKESRKTGLERLKHYGRWLEWSKGLDTLRTSADAALAVAQHYGLPTNLIDFTSDINVAAFFATHGQNQREGERACLICIDSKTYVKNINFHAMAQGTQKVAAISLHIPDLWRIQAQRGSFLEMPYANIETFYPTRRILFPFRAPWPFPPQDHIYPIQKSDLELQLDDFFELERLQRTHRETMEWLDSLRMDKSTIGKIWLREPTGFRPKYVDIQKVEQLPRWPSEDVAAWLREPDEGWSDVMDYAVVRISLADLGPDLDLEGALYAITMSAIRAEPNLRCRHWQFQILDPAKTFHLMELERMEQLWAHLWDGMRRLPFSIEQIGCTLSRVLWLELLIDRKPLYDGRGWKGVFESVIPDLQKLELGMPSGTGGSAFLPRQSFVNGLRPEVAECLLPEFTHFIDQPEKLLQVITAPEILFELGVLAGLFSEHLIPTQAIIYGLDQPLIFNPARLKVIGPP